AVGVGLCAHTGETAAQAALEGAQALPLEAVEGISGRMGLRDGAAGELSAPVVVVALGAGEIELALAAMEGFSACIEKGFAARVDRDIDRQAARLHRDIRGQREQLFALESERLRLLPRGAAEVDPLLQVHRAPRRGVEGRITRGDALHARARVAVT